MAAAIPAAGAWLGSLITGAGGAAAAGGTAAAAGGGGLAAGLTAGATALTAATAAKSLLAKNSLPKQPKTIPLPDDAVLNAARRRRLATEVAASGPLANQLTGTRTLGG